MYATNRAPDGTKSSTYPVCDECGGQHHGKPLESIPLFPADGVKSGTFDYYARGGNDTGRMILCVICNCPIR